MSNERSNPNTSHAASYEHIATLFMEEATDWNRLFTAIKSALFDPFLPRRCRLEPNAILAYYGDDVEQHIQAAKTE